MQFSLKSLAVAACAAAIVGSATTASAAPLRFDFASVVGSSIDIAAGGAFTFNNASDGDPTTYDPGFQVTLKNGPWPLANNQMPGILGDYGDISGAFQIGAVSACGTGECANVSGIGTFRLRDSAGQFLSADLVWNNITQQGTGNTLNFTGSVNLTNFAYAGLDADYLAFFERRPGSVTLTFQFNPARTLNDIVATGGSTSYSGTANVPEPVSAVLLGIGLLGAGVAARRRK